jgi:NitT/TauT family transport system ATP-binding protein
LNPGFARPGATAVPVVEAQDAGKTYPNGTQALLPVNLRVQPGEFVTLLGPSGCGKSTLLKMVAGLLAPSSGRLLLWGQPAEQMQGRAGGQGQGQGGRQGLSFVFQEATLMPWARVLANVRLPLDLAGVPRAEADERVRAALHLVGLQAFEGALPRELSGGMQMRVSIARGLVTRPALLLMDEPFGALDEITRNRLDSDLLALWQAQALTVLFVTHSIHEAVYLSTRVLVMGTRPGRVVDEVRLDEPYPRGPDFRVSTAFSRHARRLQDSLLAASGEAAA